MEIRQSNVEQKLINELQNYSFELLNLLQMWYNYHNEVLKQIVFIYEKNFSDIEYEIEKKSNLAYYLEKKYQILSHIVNCGKPITQSSIKFIDKLLEIENNRNQKYPFRKSRFSEVLFFTVENKQLKTEHNDVLNLSQLYRQLVKYLHPDVVGENNEYKNYWNSVQYYYKIQDAVRLNMLYIALNCNDIINTADDEMVFINRINELKKSIEKQENDINELKTQEPFCFEKQINDKNWVEERKKQLRNKLVQLNKKITYNDQLIKKIIKC